MRAKAGADDGRQAVLPADDGRVRHHPADVGYGGSDAAEDGRPTGGGDGADQHFAGLDLFQFGGVDTDCIPWGNGVADYSTGGRAPLDERALSEAAGICGGVALDWNGNTVLDLSPVAVDLNGDGTRSVLTDHDDWDSIVFYGPLATADGAPVGPHAEDEPEIITEQPVPPHARQVP